MVKLAAPHLIGENDQFVLQDEMKLAQEQMKQKEQEKERKRERERNRQAISTPGSASTATTPRRTPKSFGF